MIIAIDAMGGDLGLEVVLQGCSSALQEIEASDHILLVGDEVKIKSTATKLALDLNSFTIVHASEVIEMGEHPTKAMQQKPDNSILKGFGLLMAKKADVFCSAGSTGAMMVGAMFTIKTIPGVLRPAVAAYLPQDSGKYNLVLDVGLNAECKPEVLAQFAEMGSLFSRYYFGVEKPKIGLMNLGTEEGKGTTISQAAYALIKENQNIHFVGNIEGRDVFNDTVDVVVCDGFVGNVLLKSGESMYPLLKKRGFIDSFVELYNWKNVGGTPVIGVNGNVVIGHGASDAYAIKNMIKQSAQLANSKISEKIKEQFSE